jgi:GNAT superfamily N-acetyltransferase
MIWAKAEFTVSDRKDIMDVAIIHGFLTTSYWAKGIDRTTIERAIANSLCLGVFHNDKQIGFGRAITDRSTFAYLADVFILEEYRGRGLGKWLVDCFLEHEELQGLRRWLLATLDAHDLYRQKGFVPLQEPQRFMEISMNKEKAV